MALRDSLARKKRNGLLEKIWRSISYNVSADAKFVHHTSPGTFKHHLPVEIWRRVIGFAVRFAGGTNVDLEDFFSLPYLDEEHREVDPGLYSDRRSIRAVCRTWRAAVNQISVEYLMIYSEEYLLQVISLFKASKRNARKKGGKALGEWTTRIDFKFLGPYSWNNVVRLLSLTPNLMIYVNKGRKEEDAPECRTPKEVIYGLIKFCAQTLRRIEWSGPGEAPDYNDLVFLTHSCPNIQTMHLTCLYSGPAQMSLYLYFPKLKNLSLGDIPAPSQPRRPNYPTSWGPLLTLLSLSPVQLPLLERLDIAKFPIGLHPFFAVHGAKIKHFGVTSWSVARLLPEAMELFPNVDTLVLSHAADLIEEWPKVIPKLRRLCVIPRVDETVNFTGRDFEFTILIPLDALLCDFVSVKTPLLQEIRLRNDGTFRDLIDHPNWLEGWWRRWNIRNVQFCDKSGKLYNNIVDEDERLLDSIRC